MLISPLPFREGEVFGYKHENFSFMIYHKTFHRAFRGILFFLFILGLNSCFDDHWDLDRISDEIEINPGIAAPLAYGILSIDDLINKFDTAGRVKKFEDSLLYLVYKKELMSYKASEILNIPDQDFPEIYISSDINIPEWLVSGLGDEITFVKEKKEEFVFENNERLDSIRIKQTTLHIHVESEFHHSGSITVTSENILINGEKFSREVQISDASGNFSYDADIPVDGAIVTLDNTDPTLTTIPFTYELKLVNSGAAINSDESCSIAISIRNIEFSSVFGYLGDHEVLLNSGEVDIDLFDDALQKGNIFFADPKIQISVENSYGVPVSLELSNMVARSKKNNSTSTLVFTGINPFQVTAPAIDRIGQADTTLIEINKDNSNIDEAMNIQPESFTYSVNAITNPGNPTSANNFATDSSDMKIDLEVLLPLWVRADGFILEDTLDWDYENEFGEDTDFVEYLRLGMEAQNRIPAQVKLQLYFKDENYVTLDSLFHDNDFLLHGAGLDNNEKAGPAVTEEKTVEITASRIEKVKPTKHLLVRATLNSTGADQNKFVKYYSYYTIDFKLKLKARLNLNTRDL